MLFGWSAAQVGSKVYNSRFERSYHLVRDSGRPIYTVQFGNASMTESTMPSLASLKLATIGIPSYCQILLHKVRDAGGDSIPTLDSEAYFNTLTALSW